MKNLKSKGLLILALMSIFLSVIKADAQRRNVYKLSAMRPTGKVISTPDTTVNVDTTYLVLANKGDTTGIQAFNEYEDLIYSWSIVPSISGTTTGTVTIEGSMTGVFSNSTATISDWVVLISDVTQENTSSSVSVSGAAQAFYRFILPKNQFKYIRIRFISAGTQTSVITGTVSVLPHG